MNYPAMEPAPVMVVPTTQAPAPKKCERMNRRKWNRCGEPTVVTGTPAQVEAAQEEVNKYSSRIHVTAIAMIALGVVSLVGSIYSGLNARKGAEKWIAKAEMKKQAMEGKNHTMSEQPKDSEFVSKAEFALVDNLRIISFLAILISGAIIKTGKQALRASWRLRADFTRKVFKKSMMRIAFIAVVSFVIRSYIKDSKATVKKHVRFTEFSHVNKTAMFHHKKHHSRKLESLNEFDFETDVQDQDDEIDFQNDSQMRKFMDMIKGDIKQAEDEADVEEDNQDVETAASHQEEVPAWMRKGMFAQPQESSHGVTFEADTVEEKKHHRHGKKDKKHHRHGKKDHKNGEKDHKKRHHCCGFFKICFVALVVGHLYTLKKLVTSLTALESLGANMRGYKKACQEKKAAAAVVVADEEQAPQNIEYTFDEHVDKEEFPVVQQPINYTINEPSTQMQ